MTSGMLYPNPLLFAKALLRTNSMSFPLINLKHRDGHSRRGSWRPEGIYREGLKGSGLKGSEVGRRGCKGWSSTEALG